MTDIGVSDNAVPIQGELEELCSSPWPIPPVVGQLPIRISVARDFGQHLVVRGPTGL